MTQQPPAGIAVLPGETPVLVAEPVRWEVEFRCFVLDRHIIAMSPYLRNGALAMDDDSDWIASEEEWHEARTFGLALLGDAEFTLPDAIVLDIGLISGRGWAVIETNGAWGAGLYGCAPTPVLAVIQRAIMPAHASNSMNRRWLRRRVEAEW
jgi:hypothetical protein